jgi:isopenicillin N synthase-like dioxygenase
MTTIPLLDLARWFDGDDAERRALAAELDAHLQRLGFLIVVHHGIPDEVIDTCRAEAKAFFHQPVEVKQAVAATADVYRGWVGPGLESNAATYGVDTPPDLKETWAYGPLDVTPELAAASPRQFVPNVWPEEPSAFRAAAEAWWLAGKRLADDLLDIASVALGLPEHHLRDRCCATTALGTLNWYHPRGDAEPEEGQFRIGPHTDFGMFTVLDREPGAGGLQVLDEDGAWIDAPYVPGSLVVNTGDLLRHWTNDRWSSNVHRVLPPPASNRDEELLSLVFFHEPDHDAWVEAFPTCVSAERPAKYPGVLASDYLAAKMDALVVGG